MKARGPIDRSANNREAREAKVLEHVRALLPQLEGFGSVIQISLADRDDPATPEGAMFTVTTSHAFICRRGG